MDGKLKVALRILFLIVLIWLLGAMSGYLPGARIRIGPGRGRNVDGNRHVRGSGAESQRELFTRGRERAEFLRDHEL
jgi:hypothetical protein